MKKQCGNCWFFFDDCCNIDPEKEKIPYKENSACEDYQSSELMQENIELVEMLRECAEELMCWIGQYGCECGHTACSKCKDSNDGNEVLEKIDELLKKVGGE